MALDVFSRSIADLCRAEPARTKWVVVPAHSTGLALGDRLARDGCDWVNLRFATPLDIAVRMAAPFLVEQGIDPSEETLGAPLVMRLLLALPVGDGPAGERAGYFRPMVEHTSMAEALWRTLRELRYAGLRAADLGSRPFTGIAAKRDELVALVSAYERHLEAARIADMPAVFEEAGRHPDWSPIRDDDLLVELPGRMWPPVVRRFLDGLPGARPPAPKTPTRSPAPVSFFHAGGRDAEIDEVFRRIAASSLPLDQVEVACAAGVRPALIWEKAARLGWPVTVSTGLPATTTRPARLLMRFCDWIESGLEAAELRRLLQSGDCRASGFGAGPDAADLSPGQAARLLLKSGATWGRGTYAAALTRLAEEYERAAADAEAGDEDRAWQARKGRQSRALAAWVAATLASLPETIDQPRASVPLSRVVDAATRFLEANAGRASALDAIGATATREALADLVALGTYECPVPTALKFLRERVASLTVGRDRPRPGHLHVSSLHDAGVDGRRLAFVVGLEEGAVFSAAVEDAVLLDEERRALGGLLRTSHDRQRDDLHLVLLRLASLRESAERLCFSFSCRDTREFRETFPSWIVLDAFRRQQGNSELTYKDLRKHLGEPASPVASAPSSALTDAGWWVAQTCARPGPGGAGSHTAGTVWHRRQRSGAILAAFPSLALGARAEAERASDAFTSFDGFVPEAGAALDPSRTGRPVSATTLEAAAACPLRFFMRTGLGVRPIDEGRADEDAWLAPTTRGSELHALYARVMRAVRSEGRRPSLEVDGPRLRQWGAERLAALRVEMPPPSEEVFARESREFLEDLDAFVAAECAGRHGRDPVAFEVPFGFPPQDSDTEPLASPDALRIPVGGGRRFVIHGRIDRINRLGPREYEVADYKSSYFRDAWQGVFAGGTRLQHAIYGAAARQLLQAVDPGARVVRGTYLFPRVRGFGARLAIDTPPDDRLREVLRDLADLIGAGAFAPADEGRSCRWCEYAAACHASDQAQVGVKVEDEHNAALAPYRRLRSHP